MPDAQPAPSAATDVAPRAAAAAAAAAAANGNNNNNNGRQPARLDIRGILTQLLFMYMMYNMFFKSKSTVTPVVDPVTGAQLPPHRQLWREHQKFDMFVFVDASEDEFDDFENEDKAIWVERGFSFDWAERNTRNLTLDNVATASVLSELTTQNGTLYAHIFLVKTGHPLTRTHPRFLATARHYITYPLVEFHELAKRRTTYNLLAGEDTEAAATEDGESGEDGADGDGEGGEGEADEDGEEEADEEPRPWVGYWKPMLHLRIVPEWSTWGRGKVPEQFLERMVFDDDGQHYYPIFYVNDFWLRHSHYRQLNDTVTAVPLEMSVEPIAVWKWQMQDQMTKSWQMQNEWGTSSEGEQDEFKRMLEETNPYFLGLTFVVSLLHSVFDFLAFKNDIKFWNDRKDMTGLSVRTVLINCGMQLIIFLYLLDHETTSWMILISAGVGLLIEVWKIKKAVKEVHFDPSRWYFPVRFVDHDSYKAKTREHDIKATRWLLWVLLALLVCYSGYSVVYHEHKGWYSFVLGSLVGTVYTFGFVMMTPQLFLNYKLKSVAHLPWRTMTYKFLNTIIDDLFAFIIPMPTLHRLSCFRDDLVFLIYIYQRWIYRVDPNRVNEYGQVHPDRKAGDTLVTDSGETVQLPAAEGEASEASAVGAAGAAGAASEASEASVVVDKPAELKKNE